MSVHELDRFCVHARKCANKKELPHSKPAYTRLLEIAEESIKKNRKLIELIENDLFDGLPADLKTIAIHALNNIDGEGSNNAD